MGLDSKPVPPLPAPTETETATPTDLTTDISKPGDEKSSYSLPDDGTPVTIRTRGHKANRSQTSLLIEYFEGSKPGSGSERKPSVRVRLTPSKKTKGDHIQVTETKGSRKASLTRRIPLQDAIASREIELAADDGNSMTSYASATEESNVSRNPIDIEIDRNRRRRRPSSPLIPSAESYQPGNPSEFSAIPTDSFLDGSGGTGDSPLRDRQGSASAMGEISSNKTRGKERAKTTTTTTTSSTEKSREKSDRKRHAKSRTNSTVGEHAPNPQLLGSPRRRSKECTASAAESSLLSSNLSPSHRSVDTRSARSGASNSSSINNPKLLETVEDAIRRLILPELSALKREQSKREDRSGSLTSTGTSASRDEFPTDRRRQRGDRDALRKRPDYDDASLRSLSRESVDYEPVTPKRSNNLLKAAVAKSASALNPDEKDRDGKADSPEPRPRERRRRGHDRYSGDLDVDRDDEDDYLAPAPPMPLMSDVNPSDMTRTSILSAVTDRPHSASEELVVGHVAASPSPALTPTGTRTPVDLQRTLGTRHANVSHGDLTALPRGKRDSLDDGPVKEPAGTYEDYNSQRELLEEDDEDDFENRYYAQQDVPPPLKYVPYQAGIRGLSPIPSVSGYTEGGTSEVAPALQGGASRESHTPQMPSSPRKSPALGRLARSAHSQESVRSKARSAELDAAASSRDALLEHSTQTVRGVGANPDFVHPPLGVESAVASLVDGSMLDQSVLTTGSHNGARDSTLSYDEQGGHDKEPVGVRHAGGEASTASLSRTQSHEDFSEYEVDDQGRKVVPRSNYRHSPTASEEAITAGAVGAAAAALKAAQERRQATVEDDDGIRGPGVSRNRSFKERTLQGWQPRHTPAHSVDRLDLQGPVKMGASGVPDLDDPMPEVGFVEDEDDGLDAGANRSVVEERLDGGRRAATPWSGRVTPTAMDRDLGITEAAGAAALGAAVGMAAMHDQDEWHRTSDERKRDTLVTNPYEDASPIVNAALDDKIRGLDGPFRTGSPGFGQKYDEGYMSNGPNRTPEGGEGRGKAVDYGGDDGYMASRGHGRHLSGMSQGMASPFYDAATGAGIERIENRDIVALMQHLMVRDAQRSARDTEIVALLMNAALEMRNSFREMKELVQDTGDDVIFSTVENTDKIQKTLGGPRPYPGTASRSMQSGLASEDSASKKRNLWRRALQGLSAKGTNDLSRIEDMLMQLLGEVDVLKTQTARPASTGQSLLDNLQYEQDKGYEPEGISTASHGSQSGHLLPVARMAERKPSDHRITTVEEEEEAEVEAEEARDGEEEEEEEGEDDIDGAQGRGDEGDQGRYGDVEAKVGRRGGSLPPETPPQQQASSSSAGGQQAASAENTPRTDKGKKHKSSSSSGWLPKISRWSETTASSVGRALRAKKGGRYDDGQRSGSSLASMEEHYRHDGYDKLHSGFSDPNVVATATGDDPKYKAHRNSLNLQHPQPRPGQTERFRTALETSAQEFANPQTPRSAEWAGSATSLDREYWSANKGGRAKEGSSPTTARPGSESGYGTMAYAGSSPRLEKRNLGVPTRRPTGPRAMTPKSPDEEAAREERRRKRGEFGS
ncbi:hypothetical protein CDD80_6939 [Ophiocordyceps camponoti-rufipedis]|uniref:Uncharacterized protein n=1 Tax=Ophiocordyceps camponoti-rufipedis TaxID=2004952 RepID=A0A2C5YKB6_9HYPO|nr:hypothetical protein CDD80_6939 [Ophiocordyceps camponoti-rufipedis]